MTNTFTYRRKPCSFFLLVHPRSTLIGAWFGIANTLSHFPQLTTDVSSPLSHQLAAIRGLKSALLDQTNADTLDVRSQSTETETVSSCRFLSLQSKYISSGAAYGAGSYKYAIAMSCIGLEQLIQYLDRSFPLLKDHPQLQGFLENAPVGLHAAILHNQALFPNEPSFHNGHFFAVLIEKKPSGEIHIANFDSCGDRQYLNMASSCSKSFRHARLNYSDSSLTITLHLPSPASRQLSEPLCYAYALQDAYLLSQLTHLTLTAARTRFYQEHLEYRIDDLKLALHMYEALMVLDNENPSLYDQLSLNKNDTLSTHVQVTALDDEIPHALGHQPPQHLHSSSLIKYGLFCVSATVTAMACYTAISTLQT